MKQLKKSQIIAIAVVVLGLGAAGAGVIHAASTTTSTTSNTNRMTGLVNAIAQKFNLNTNDVQQVFNDQKAAGEVQRQQAVTDRINQAVTAGQLTQDQADKIIAKQKELQQDRQADMQTQLQALKQWETDNNIPAGYLPFGGPGMGGMGRGHR